MVASLSDPATWLLQLGLGSLGTIAGAVARTRLRIAGCHFASFLTAGQVVADEGLSALVTQQFRHGDQGFLRRSGYELAEGLVARAFLHFGLRVFNQLVPGPSNIPLRVVHSILVGIALSIGGLIGEQVSRRLGSQMHTTPWTLTGLGLRVIDSEVAMFRGGVLRTAPLVRRLSPEGWAADLEERRGAEPYLNRLLKETRLVLSPRGRELLDVGYMETGRKSGAPLTRDEFFYFLSHRLGNIGGVLHGNGQLGARWSGDRWDYAYNNPEGVFRSAPHYYDCAVALLKMIRKAERAGWNVMGEMYRVNPTPATRVAFEALKESLGRAPISYRLDHYFPTGTPERAWFDVGWQTDPRFDRIPHELVGLGDVIRERLRNAASPASIILAKRWIHRPELRENCQRMAPKLRAITSLIEDIEAQGHLVLDPQRFRLSLTVPLLLREEPTHRLDLTHLAEDLRVLFGVEGEALSQLVASLESTNLNTALRGDPSDRDAVRIIKEFLTDLERAG